MTSTQEPGEGQEVLHEFAVVAERYMEGFNFDAEAEQVIAQLLIRGSQEMLRLPVGSERDEAVLAAVDRLEAAMEGAAVELRGAGQVNVDVETLTMVMQSMCPVPPFCTGMGGPDDGALSSGYDDSSSAVTEPAMTGA